MVLKAVMTLDLKHLEREYEQLMPRIRTVLTPEQIGQYCPVEAWLRDCIIDLESPLKVALEIGCGNGKLLLSLVSDLVVDDGAGVDISPSMASMATTAAVNADLDIDFYATSIEEYEASRYYDVIICTETLEHLMQPGNAVSKIRQWLTPEGLFCGSVPLNNVCDHYSHLHYYDTESLLNLLYPYFAECELAIVDNTNEGENHICFACRKPREEEHADNRA